MNPLSKLLFFARFKYMPKLNSFANSNTKAEGINTLGSKNSIEGTPVLPQKASVA